MTRGRLAGQYDAEMHALSMWRHKWPKLHQASPPPKTATPRGTGYIGATRGYATHGNPFGRLGDAIILTGL